MAQRPAPPKFTWAKAFHGIVIAAMNKGHLPFVALVIILLVILYKMPGDDIAEVMKGIVQSMAKGQGIGWALFVLAIVCWYGHVKMMIRSHFNECKRIGEEKNELQARLNGSKFLPSQAKLEDI